MSAEVLALVGPTGSGKTTLSLKIAESLPVEIVGCDAMQVYRGLRVMTAQPSATDIAGVPHHLIAFRDPGQDFDVAEYCDLASAAIEKIKSVGKRVLIVGGTGFYLDSLLFGIYDAPEGDESLRERIAAEIAERGAASVWEELRTIDPASASRIHPNNLKRLVRALEIIRMTGKAPSSLPKKFEGIYHSVKCKVMGLNVDRPLLKERIARQVRERFKSGMLEEASWLRALPPGRSASQVLGYKESLEVNDGKMSLEKAQAVLTRRTTQYAKRQMTWFNAKDYIQWGSPEEIYESVTG